MSADEIRRLADNCKGKASYYKNITPCSDLEHDKWWYRDAAKKELDKAAALLDYAAMVERCEKLIRPCSLEDAPCVPSDTGYCDSCDVPKHNDMINYILKGATGGTKC